MDSAASIFLLPIYSPTDKSTKQILVKAFHRAASSLLQLGLAHESALLCDIGLAFPGSNSLVDVKKQAAASASKSIATSKESERSQRKKSSALSHLTEKEVHKMQEGPDMNAEAIAMMNNMMVMLESSGKGVGEGYRVDMRVTQFHKEFQKQKLWPSEVNQEQAY